MVLLVLGVALWSAVHLAACARIDARSRLIDRIGIGPYKGAFSMSLLVAIALMVAGWRSSAPVALYATAAAAPVAVNIGMFIALLLFAASALPSNLKRMLRHPQLTGFALWAGLHLLANGDLRSVCLFGGLGLWAVVAMQLLNRRDGAWVKPAAHPIAVDLLPLLAAGAAFAALSFGHLYLFGVSSLPR